MRLLIADDDPTTRLMVRGVLTKAGYDVTEATSGEAAWQQLAGSDPPPLAIVDWMMPDLSGPDLCRRLKASPAGDSTYTILLTSRSEARDVVLGLESGADDFVAKPYHPDELRARVGVGRRVIDLRRQLLEANAVLEHRVRERTRDVERLLRWDEELLHHLSHDLKTPLTPLVSLLPMLQEDERDPERRQMLQWAIDGARSIQAMTAGVLEYTRATALADSLRPRRVPARELVETVLDQVRQRHLLRQRTLHNRVPDDLQLYADPLHVRRALERLVANAVKYTADDGQIEIDGTRNATEAILSVHDDGIGLEAADLARIFQPFYKADQSRHDRGALGLGLAMARILVEHHGGRIWAESAGQCRGSTFHCAWPLDGQQSRTPNL